MDPEEMDRNALTGLFGKRSFRWSFQRNILAGKGYHKENSPGPEL
jgi:hypothetical protein